MSSVVGPQSVPSRISVVLVEETEVWGIPFLWMRLYDCWPGWRVRLNGRMADQRTGSGGDARWGR